MGRSIALSALIAAAGISGVAWQTPARPGIAAPRADEWPSHLHDPAGTRYSPLTQITPANVSQLKVAWEYHMRPALSPEARAGGPPPAPATGGGFRRGGATGFSQSEVTPIVYDGLLYITTPYTRVVALDATTGKEAWVFSQPVAAVGSTRGVELWAGDASHTPRLVFHGGGGLVELDPKTGEPITEFGTNGVLAPAAGGGTSGSSPPVLYRNVIVSQSANPNRDGRSGDIRGFDVVTGRQLWRFGTIPSRDEPGYNTWAPGSAERQSAVHVWGPMTLDAQRGIVYGATNAPEWNRYGGDRAGDNLYSSTLLALDALTGKLLWHFQMVHHDIWDLDGAPPPVLIDVRQGTRTIPAIAAASKAGLLFILDRVTGQPIHGVEERKVPASEIPEERTSPTQPFPVKPPPLGRQTFSMDDVADVTPELHDYCANLLTKYKVQMGGPYMPPGFNRPSVNFPGPNASTNWGGGAYDPRLGYLVINSQDLGQITEIGPRDIGRELTIGMSGAGSGNNPNIPYDMVGVNGRFKHPDLNMMCQQPPWGSLTAVNVNTGEFAWRVPLGLTENLPPEKQKTGRPSSGGPIVTAGGVTFIGATDDNRFRAFDTKTGQELWVEKLPASSHSVPITYMGRDGRQYLVFPATGGSFLQDPAVSDSLFAYAIK